MQQDKGPGDKNLLEDPYDYQQKKPKRHIIEITFLSANDAGKT